MSEKKAIQTVKALATGNNLSAVEDVGGYGLAGYPISTFKI